MAGINFDITASTAEFTTEVDKSVAALKQLDKAGDDAAKALDDVGDESKSAAKETSKATKSIAGLADEAEKASKAGKQLAKGTDKTTVAAKEASKSFENAKRTADGMGGVFGETAGRVENLSMGIGGLIDEMGPLGIAGGTVALGFLAGAGFVAAVNAGVVKVIELADAAAESIEDLERFQGALKIDAATVASVQDSAAGLDTARIAAEKLNVEFVAGLSPAIQEGSALVVAFALAGRDAAQGAADYADTLIGLVNFALSPVTTATLLALEAQIKLTEWMGGEVPQATKDFVAELKASMLPIESFEFTIDKTTIALGGYYEQAQSSIAVAIGQKRAASALAAEQDAVATATTKAAKATEDAAAASTDYILATAPIPDTVSETYMALSESLALYTEETIAADNAVAEARNMNLDEWLGKNGETVSAALDLTAQLTDTVATMFEEMSARKIAAINNEIATTQAALDKDAERFKERGEQMTQDERDALFKRVEANKKALKKQKADQQAAEMKAFKMKKRAALVGVAIDTAQGVMGAIARFGPPPSPLGIIGIAAAIAAGGVNAGIIASQKPPPFRIGGVVPDDAPMLPGGLRDQRLIAAEPGELVLNQEQQRAMGGGGGAQIFVLDGGVFRKMQAREATRQERAAVMASPEIGV